MMKEILKKFAPIAVTSLFTMTTLAYAQGDTNAQIRNLENRVTALEQRKGATGMINPPGRPQVRGGADLFIFGDVLYWNAHENGLFYAIKNKNNENNLSHADVKNIHGDWNVGFRVGIGYNLPHDGWDLHATWLRFTDHEHKSVHARSNRFVFPTLAHPADPISQNDFCQKSHAHWKLRLNQLDLDLGREFFTSKWLTLRPHAGIRTDWIRQKLEVDYKNFSNSTIPNKIEVELKDRWWGIGLEGGLDTQWGLCNGWSLFGNLCTAIIYGFHDLKFEDDDTPPSFNVTNDSTSFPNGTFVDLDNTYRISHPILDLEMGLRWDNMFSDDRVHLGLQIGWEHHIYFSQNQFPIFTDDLSFGQFVSNQGDLTLQGWTFSARLDF